MNVRTRALGVLCVGCVAASGYVFSTRSAETLAPVSPALQNVATCALQHSSVDFVVYHGFRTDAEQRGFLAAGVTWVNRSRHQDGKAIDVMAMDPATKKGTWDPVFYEHIAKVFYFCGAKLGVDITWGGEWRVQDLVHFEETRR